MCFSDVRCGLEVIAHKQDKFLPTLLIISFCRSSSCFCIKSCPRMCFSDVGHGLEGALHKHPRQGKFLLVVSYLFLTHVEIQVSTLLTFGPRVSLLTNSTRSWLGLSRLDVVSQLGPTSPALRQVATLLVAA
jgi:hypothetical protein